MPKSAAAAPFTGFDRSAMSFWHELALEMSKDWFVEHKQRYQDLWVAPMTALLGDVARRIAPAYRPHALGEPGVLRIYRDVRFSNDKTPYKTHIAGVIRFAGKKLGQVGTAVLYLHLGLHLGLDEEYVGVGCYQFDASKLVRWRKAVTGKPGAALLPVIAKLRKAGYTVDRDDDYKRLPQGFAADHPRAALLRRKGITAAFPEIPAGLLHKAGFADWLVQHAKATAPLVAWLHEHVG